MDYDHPISIARRAHTQKHEVVKAFWKNKSNRDFVKAVTQYFSVCVYVELQIRTYTANLGFFKTLFNKKQKSKRWLFKYVTQYFSVYVWVPNPKIHYQPRFFNALWKQLSNNDCVNSAARYFLVCVDIEFQIRRYTANLDSPSLNRFRYMMTLSSRSEDTLPTSIFQCPLKKNNDQTMTNYVKYVIMLSCGRKDTMPA